MQPDGPLSMLSTTAKQPVGSATHQLRQHHRVNTNIIARFYLEILFLQNSHTLFIGVYFLGSGLSFNQLVVDLFQNHLLLAVRVHVHAAPYPFNPLNCTMKMPGWLRKHWISLFCHRKQRFISLLHLHRREVNGRLTQACYFLDRALKGATKPTDNNHPKYRPWSKSWQGIQSDQINHLCESLGVQSFGN